MRIWLERQLVLGSFIVNLLFGPSLLSCRLELRLIQAQGDLSRRLFLRWLLLLSFILFPSLSDHSALIGLETALLDFILLRFLGYLLVLLHQAFARFIETSVDRATA